MASFAKPEEAGRPAPRGAYAAAWLVLVCFYTALFAASGVPVAMAARGAAAAALPPALMGLVSLGLARRWPWSSAGRWRRGLRVAAAIFGLTAASVLLWLVIVQIDLRLFSTPGRRPSAPIVAWQFLMDLLLLSSLAFAGYAREGAEALRRAREDAARAEALRARAELEVLRSQVQPHFILNVLHALLGLVRRDPSRAEEALEKLGDLLRYGQEVHGENGDRVPLSREWEFVGSYLELERMRLGNRLSVEIEADPAALEVPVPPFALQPLVENAVTHGVANRSSGGRVRVAARRFPGGVRLTVWDDGAGATETQLSASPRIGLRLVRERLAALYDGRARLSFVSPEGGGFEARLELPDEPPGERG